MCIKNLIVNALITLEFSWKSIHTKYPAHRNTNREATFWYPSFSAKFEVENLSRPSTDYWILVSSFT